MFTIKYRYYTPAKTQPVDGPKFYDECESCHGPFEVVNQARDDNGYIEVHGIRGRSDGYLPMTFGPFHDPNGEDVKPGQQHPRPTLWVMNEAGATVAKYDL
jgi:hypothetical protein